MGSAIRQREKTLDDLRDYRDATDARGRPHPLPILSPNVEDDTQPFDITMFLMAFSSLFMLFLTYKIMPCLASLLELIINTSSLSL